MTVARQQSISFLAEDIPVLNHALLVYLDEVSKPLEAEPGSDDWDKLMAMRDIQLKSIERLRVDLAAALKELRFNVHEG